MAVPSLVSLKLHDRFATCLHVPAVAITNALHTCDAPSSPPMSNTPLTADRRFPARVRATMTVIG